MATSGAQPGNSNATKAKPWAEALRVSLATYQKGDIKQGQALRRIADKVIEKALEGDPTAITEIGNRQDGKPHQSVDVDATVAGQIIVQMASKDADI